MILRQLTEALPDAVKQLGLPVGGLTELAGYPGYSLPVELVEMIHQHKALPDHLFFQPACEGSVDPDTVDTRQRLMGRCWFHGVYAAVEWEGWDDDQDFLNCWRSFDYSETYWVESGDQYSDSEDDDAEEPDSEEEAEEADHGAEQDTSSEEATDGY